MDAHLTKPTKPAGFALSNPVPQTKWEAHHDTRDPECPVCQALLENHVALPAPPQGAAKGANDAASS